MTVRALPPLHMRTSAHESFARLSGDVNPIHVDAAYARRTIAGEPVVHGIHLLLQALEAHFATARPLAAPRTISARFLKPAFPDDPMALSREVNDGVTRLSVGDDGAVAAITLAPGRSTTAGGRTAEAQRVAPRRIRRTPAVQDVADLDGLAGTIAAADSDAARRQFPRASRALGPRVVAALARLSTIVGMECPGRDSLLSQVSLDIAPGARPPTIAWRVTRVDRLLRLVRIAVEADGVSGTILAFIRRPPVAPPGIETIGARVTPDEFAGQRAIVIGGSRGLGATTALIVAAGGGVPLITYREGAAEATALQRTLAAAGHGSQTLRFDVTASAAPLARAAARFGATHLYYFATPKIFARRRDPFDAALFARFAGIYVDGFARACAAVAGAAPALRVFYPSSTAIDERLAELREYAAAKAAGEALSDSLQAAMPGVTIVHRRLPRIATDQTATLIAAPAADPVDVMLSIVRELHGQKRATP